jgi:hypothetical protein
MCEDLQLPLIHNRGSPPGLKNRGARQERSSRFVEFHTMDQTNASHSHQPFTPRYGNGEEKPDDKSRYAPYPGLMMAEI